ncbi:hypothetical protein AAFF_G00022390 [Aldrovandia affinis]|uniref:Uncharacterized protein n=1 Tax=Aldrovandia affinis TaxID=143900 RepID=A0AAD7VXF2_9TELE|nr:hypothetical protein AAFF_G00022390 [Aldrovandia affinis]
MRQQSAQGPASSQCLHHNSAPTAAAKQLQFDDTAKPPFASRRSDPHRKSFWATRIEHSRQLPADRRHAPTTAIASCACSPQAVNAWLEVESNDAQLKKAEPRSNVLWLAQQCWRLC